MYRIQMSHKAPGNDMEKRIIDTEQTVQTEMKARAYISSNFEMFPKANRGIIFYDGKEIFRQTRKEYREEAARLDPWVQASEERFLNQ